MWRPLLLLGAVGLAAVAVLATAKPDAGGGGTGPDMPPGYMLSLGRLTTPFAPKLRLGAASFSLGAGSARQVGVASSSERVRVATLVLRSGTVATISFCRAGAADCCQANGSNCDRNPPTCLTPNNATVPPGVRCAPKPGPRASLGVESVGGELTLSAPSGAAVIGVE